MAMRFLQIASIVASGLLVGNEIAVGAFMHPQLYHLDDRVHATSAQAFARIYGRVMPFWYAAVLVLTGAVALTIRPAWSTSGWLAIASASLWAASIAFTVIGPVPINNSVIRWDLDDLPANWKEQRRRWDQLHGLRMLIILIALICLIASCLEARVQ